MGVSDEMELSNTQETINFVWTVRLAKISRCFIDRKWSYSTLSRGATFALDDKVDEGQQAVDTLQDEGFEGIGDVNLKGNEGVFITRPTAEI